MWQYEYDHGQLSCCSNGYSKNLKRVRTRDTRNGLLYNEAQQDAKVAQTALTYILTVHKNE